MYITVHDPAVCGAFIFHPLLFQIRQRPLPPAKHKMLDAGKLYIFLFPIFHCSLYQIDHFRCQAVQCFQCDVIIIQRLGIFHAFFCFDFQRTVYLGRSVLRRFAVMFPPVQPADFHAASGRAAELSFSNSVFSASLIFSASSSVKPVFSAS